MKNFVILLLPIFLIFVLSFYQPMFVNNSEKSMIGVLIDGENKNTIPKKEDGYYIEKIECNEETIGTWNYETWSLKLSNVKNSRVKCNLHFLKGQYGKIWNYFYTGDSQEFLVPYSGKYQIELWGAQGGSSNQIGGYGGYVKGSIYLNKDTKLFVYVGQSNSVRSSTSWNGGGIGYASTYGYPGSYPGGGATDIRLINGNWNLQTGLASRLMVAGGGGGSSYTSNMSSKLETSNLIYGVGGGLIGGTGYFYRNQAQGGTQIAGGITNTIYHSPGKFGIGANGIAEYHPGGGGGSGFYGGASSHGSDALNLGGGGGGGGSSYISGHIGCVAINSQTNITPKINCLTGTTDINCSKHYSGYTFFDTVMIDGNGYKWNNTKNDLVNMPKYDGSNYSYKTGHIGNGVAKITFLGN